MSFDDGRVFDRRLVKMFNEYGVKGTFHINTSRLGQEGFIKAEELRDLYDGHEVSLHTHTHPTLAYMPKQQILYEITKNKSKSILETLTKQVICGMSYPNGSFGSNVTEQLKATGVLYSRTTLSIGKFTGYYNCKRSSRTFCKQSGLDTQHGPLTFNMIRRS